MSQTRFERLERLLPQDTLTRGCPMSGYTTMKVGGPARLMMEVRDAQQVALALEAVGREKIPVLLLGNGSNLLVADEGFEGLVIHFGRAYSQVVLEGRKITAQAGASLMGLSRLATEHSLTGLEFAAGIPASVGGAALMNAGAYGSEMAEIITSVECLDEKGARRVLRKEEIGFGYRDSLMMRSHYTVLSVTMALRPGSQEMISNLVQDYQKRRREKQPLNYPSCGSFFKRPEGYYAGALIEAAGLKGARIGGAEVSRLHAGFLINVGMATAADLFALMDHVRETVRAASGVWLEPEVRLIGRKQP